MSAAYPEEMLTWETRLQLASYDANNSDRTSAVDRLLEMFPNNPTRLLAKLDCLRQASREEQIHFLRQACAPAEADAILFIELARRLKDDARCVPEARRWLKRAKRFRRMDSGLVGVLADLDWEEGKLEQATEFYRVAANIESFREVLYQAWFLACRRTRRTSEALTYLEERFKRFGRRSEQPALTLAWALSESEQPARARQILAEAADLRPADGYLQLRAATLAARLRDNAEAEHLLASARPRVRENDWLRAAAENCEMRNDAAGSLEFSRELLQREPLALDAHARVARLLSRLQGPAAALEHLQAATARFPHHYGLRRMMVEWSHPAGPVAVETAARELLKIDFADAWACRELALALLKQKRQDEALVPAEEGAKIEPRNTYSFSVLGHVHTARREWPQAREGLRRSVQLSVDNRYALNALLGLWRRRIQSARNS